jgi:hypothetical protein
LLPLIYAEEILPGRHHGSQGRHTVAINEPLKAPRAPAMLDGCRLESHRLHTICNSVLVVFLLSINREKNLCVGNMQAARKDKPPDGVQLRWLIASGRNSQP